MKKAQIPASHALRQRARKVMPLGVSSNVRYWGAERTVYVDQAKGAYIWDADGKRYIDYRLGFGPVILGYAYEEVDAQVYKAMRSGVTTGLTGALEVQAAEKVTAMCPGVEQVRFVNSGTEAVMHALRLARAYTGREKIIKFEGGYHGSCDYVLFSTYAPPETYGSRLSPVSVPASSGIPKALNDLVITLPFNDQEALKKALRSAGNQVAAILTEPMLGNYGSIDPQPGFLDFLRLQCSQHGILLVFDEVKTGFRIALGGGAAHYGVTPDLAAYAKALGNGYAVAAYGGREEVMRLLGKGVSQGGTYSGNTVGVAAANATLGILQAEAVLPAIRRLGAQLQDGMKRIFQQHGLVASLSQHPAIFSIRFGVDQVMDARTWADSDQAYYRRFAAALLERGVLIDEDPREPWCLCYAHTAEDIEETLGVIEETVRIMQ